MCVSCRFFRPFIHDDPTHPHQCAFVDAPFGDGELRLDCPDHQAAPADHAALNWQVFRAPTATDPKEYSMIKTDIPGHTYGTDTLLAAFTGPDGQPNQAYLAAVRLRFGRWILDTARAEFDQAWLDYQHEIGVRYTRRGNNRTDGVQAADHIPLRYVLALLIPITTTLMPFLVEGGAGPEDVEVMHQAWVKAVLLQVILCSQPDVRDGDFRTRLRPQRQRRPLVLLVPPLCPDR
jgi:protoglobin